MKKIIVIALGVLYTSCSDTVQKVADPPTPTMIKTPDSLAVDRPPIYKWIYSEREDQMTDKKSYIAGLDADEQLDLKFPYNGGVAVTLYIVNSNGHSRAFLKLSKGQFTGDYITARFDHGKARTYATTESSDGDNTYTWIDRSSDICSKIKNSKQAAFEIGLYDNGWQVVNFRTVGLKWEYK